MNLQSNKGTPDSLKLRLKGFERKLSLGAPVDYRKVMGALTFRALALRQSEYEGLTLSRRANRLKTSALESLYDGGQFTFSYQLC